MKHFTTYLFLLISLLGSHFVQAQSDLTKAYDQLIANAFSIEGPGATALVAKDGQIVYQKAVGHANVELDVPMKIDNVFRIGSITKQFTAVGILMLMEQGKLGLQDEITKFIEDYPTQDQTITVEHLLTHTSGIKSMTNMPEFFGEVRKDFSTTEMIDVFKNESMEFVSGEAYNYNNSGYFLLGVIIEKVTGKPYATFIEEEIFEPLGMKNSYYDSFAKIIKNRAAGYQPSTEGIKNADYISETIPYAAGSLLSNVEDLLKWNQAVVNHKLISKESLDRAWTPYTLKNGESTGYGYGWSITKLQNTRAIEHGGGIFGYLTQGIYLPTEKVYVAVLSNCNCQSPSDVTKQLAALTIGRPLSWEAIALEEASLEEYEGVYQISEDEMRTIVMKEGMLVSKRGSSSPYNLIPIGKDEFNFEGTLTRLKFVRDAAGVITKAVAIPATGEKSEAIKTDEKAVLEEKPKLQLSDDILNRYVGIYELAPTFKIEITNENNQLHAQATGQGKLALQATSETAFYPEEVEAEVEFVLEEGKVTHLMLLQNGREMKAKKIE
ncbi:MAG: serine hydrolase [Bacteroidota bacterium]